MSSVFMDALIRTPFLGSIKLSLAERSIYKNFAFYTTSDPEELDELYKIRYKVYCEEYAYLDTKNYPDRREKDIFDSKSIHLVVRHRSGELAATARLIQGSEMGLPIQNHFQIEYDVPKETESNIAEVSRLIVARSYRRRHLLLVLIKGIYLLVKQKGITEVFCVLDDRLIPNLTELGIPIKRIGKSRIYQGLTAPYIIQVNELEEKLYEHNKFLFKFLSQGVMRKQGKDFKYSPH